ncbi:MAG: bifunctional (p)ppGpp synthetase/guanosine-3',5'-bis(diphosphate) 3'-pyrophosphohydrolase [Bacilli bacterium]|nr:bifunctional (p)ppGpp synthetase/guanosine-3',5'-bis(diphosphate) 3'-pyrophosphohydrolase [Bacilli bacterium]
MDDILFSKLINLVSNYNPDGVNTVKRAYYYAKYLHEGQYRQSGEPYIIHPLNVAYILAEYHADIDTLCAGLLHDVLEDCSDKTCDADITNMFNKNVINLVDGVTKMSKLNFSSKTEARDANTRKIITGLTNDVRIIIIKLADRIHNMRTIEFKSEYKQRENAVETLEIFVPMAQFLGIYKMKNELEDLSFKYLDKDKYNLYEEKYLDIKNSSRDELTEVRDNLSEELSKHNIDNKATYRIKNIYGIYKRLSVSDNMESIHDLLAVKFAVPKVDDCYRSLGIIHSKYMPVNSKFKDYICNPKTNNYKSLHTTLFGPNDHLIQAQIRTFAMDRYNKYGIADYWISSPNDAGIIMQEKLRKYQFYDSLIEIDNVFGNNDEFISEVKDKLFSEKVYVYVMSGEIIEMPKGSTLNDFFRKVSFMPEIKGIRAVVNNDYVDDTYVLQDNDRIKVITYEKDNELLKAKKLVKSI